MSTTLSSAIWDDVHHKLGDIVASSLRLRDQLFYRYEPLRDDPVSKIESDATSEITLVGSTTPPAPSIRTEPTSGEANQYPPGSSNVSQSEEWPPYDSGLDPIRCLKFLGGMLVVSAVIGVPSYFIQRHINYANDHKLKSWLCEVGPTEQMTELIMSVQNGTTPANSTFEVDMSCYTPMWVLTGDGFKADGKSRWPFPHSKKNANELPLNSLIFMWDGSTSRLQDLGLRQIHGREALQGKTEILLPLGLTGYDETRTPWKEGKESRLVD
ncbi:hypothetical protein M231_00858 [Tremella mesenterica]|uniref:Uncharacterized protein n=1 Tax=Tremella mesenterica TaxID=5217 RepID=A0A4Q1BUQ1_TREME|nr:uncharacterized protein TREMEDRAFT_65790 [Tremella mesenterica DSM 1558]XP_007007938.1 uncharacterized protein TREMEDRAFT_65793 [Tremella mesenterica DSM 1558]EIW66186.1 hypothetical protein TREMEDRAFT_65790 [Tremella mesenterica DSM 1558]EIW66188.1 hypothetical protein TREMEDRAFT_65793 [Tremella mesenterica DSM 1558]RXK41859.1 hypothetical protein M231_00858 [Tremella mesenterica]